MHTEIEDDKILLGKILNIDVSLVDFDPIKIKFDMDAVEGLNDLELKEHGYDYMPDNSAWLDWNERIGEWKYICLHEVIEHWLMDTFKLKYDSAHDIANYFEKEHRIKYSRKKY